MGKFKVSFSQISRLSREELLNTRLCDIEIQIVDAPAHGPVQRLADDLEGVGIDSDQVAIFFGREWGVEDGTAAIEMPWWLGHRALLDLYKEEMGPLADFSVQGPEMILAGLRHEMGHVFDTGFGVSKRKDFRRLFGNPNAPYEVEVYDLDPNSPNHVVNLGDGYAQSHPTEDFAETFAVAVMPGMPWSTTYRNHPGALEKLQWVTDRLVEFQGETMTGFTHECDPNALYSKCKKTIRDILNEEKAQAAKNAEGRQELSAARAGKAA